MDVPLYTVTGWGNVSVPEDEVIPLYGDYPEEPWMDNVTRPSSNKPFFFDSNRDSEAIGNEQLKKDGKYVVDIGRYPYFTCELGVGNQLSYHRRPILDKLDGLTIATIKVGSGSNLPGYYVFAGGTNPQSIFTPLQEDQQETGMWNEYPRMSYDFQAAITETGELAESYYQLKKLHYFLMEFGDILAPYSPSFPPTPNKEKDLQYSIRSDGERGFLFGSNYVRGMSKPAVKDVTFSVKLDREILKFPSEGLSIPDSSVFIFPFNFDLNGVTLKYATAQMLASPRTNLWVFFQPEGINTEFAIDGGGVSWVEASSGNVVESKGVYYVKNINGGIGEGITIKMSDGALRTIYLLTEKEALQSWLFRDGGRKFFFVSDADLTIDNRRLNVVYKNDFYIASFGEVPELNDKFLSKGSVTEREGCKVYYYFNNNSYNDTPQLAEASLFDGAQRLLMTVNEVPLKQQLWHKFFFKEFGLYNSADIRSAKLYIYADLIPEVRVNNKYVNQNTAAKTINVLDITGYVVKGENILQIGFPLTTEPAVMAAVMEIVFHNNNRVVIKSGEDWLSLEQYVAPVPWTSVRSNAKPSVIAEEVDIDENLKEKYYRLNVPYSAFDGVNNLYLYVDYSGDTGSAYIGHKLVCDSFNNGTTWKMNLSTYRSLIEGGGLEFIIKPLNSDARIRFDREIDHAAKISGYRIIPEYKITAPLR
ncbi:MAG: hypothetical protein LIO79_10995 [Rikenellaceae bacterium]|nr:hypothetical protein [Rikenellaceae bacterium]